MRAMLLTEVGKPLQLKEVAKPSITPDQVLVKVATCGVCRTDLHICDGELPDPKLPLILGHQIVGTVEARGTNVSKIQVGERVGIPWLGQTCGTCSDCRSGRENLCNQALFTGYQLDGGFAEYCVANAHFTFPIPSSYPDLQAAPLLCAGLIGFRALQMTENARQIGFYGFGSSAHILTQIVCHKGGEVYAFTRKGDIEGQEFAKKIGAVWAGSSDEEPPSPLDAVIVFAPLGELVPKALGAVKKGGIVVCAGIYMSAIPTFSYQKLWNERSIRSVANLTRKDGEAFLALAPTIPIQTEVHPYSLEKTNTALHDLRHGTFSGSAVIVTEE